MVSAILSILPFRGSVSAQPAGTIESGTSIRIEADPSIHWRGPAASKVFVQVDNNARQLFASGASGSQPAPRILSGHRYVFILQDENDLRQPRGSRTRG
jgi:hypothetical protein